MLAEVIRKIAAVDPAIAQIPQGHFLLVDVLAVLGTRSSGDRLFAEVLAGGRLGTRSPNAAASTPRTFRPGLRAGPLCG